MPPRPAGQRAPVGQQVEDADFAGAQVQQGHLGQAHGQRRDLGASLMTKVRQYVAPTPLGGVDAGADAAELFASSVYPSADKL
jgi:hypothetical protein